LTIYEVLVNKKPHRIKILERNGDTFLVEVNEKTVTVRIRDPAPGNTTIIEINGRALQTKVKRVQGNIFHVKISGKLFEVQRRSKTLKEPAGKLKSVVAITKRPTLKLAVEKGAVVAPIAGRIMLLKAKVGHKVKKGECICILEAMKMENEITASKTGVIKEVKVSEGAVVNKGDVLAVIT